MKESERCRMDEEPLLGGNVNHPVRIGDTVRRFRGAWSPGVHALLQHLQSRGFHGAPRFLGIDKEGREILTFMAGDVAGDRYPDLPHFMWSDGTLAAFAQLLRRYHDATRGFTPPTAAEWQMSYPDPRQHEVICHNDAALYNVVFRQGMPIALFDFDMAGPGPRLWDIAYTLYNAVPLASFAPDGSADSTEPYSPERHAIERGRRIGLFFESYGIPMPQDLQDWVVERLRALCDTLRIGAEQGNQALQHMVSEGHLAHYRGELEFLERHFRSWR